MRAAIVILIVVLVAVPGLFVPYIGLLGYVWFTLMRPDWFSWSGSMFPYSAVLEAVTVAGSVRFLPRLLPLWQNPFFMGLGLLQIPLFLSTLLAVHPELSWPFYIPFIRLMAVALLIPVLVETEKKLYILMLVMALSVGMIGSKYGMGGLVRGGTPIYDGYGGLDNNGLALALVFVLPLFWFLRRKAPWFWLKALLLTMMFFSMAAVILTRSRGGILTMGITLLLISFRSKNRILSLVLIFLLTVPPLWLFRYPLIDRMATLGDPTEDPSIRSRLTHFKAAPKMWRDYPLLGVGFGNENYMALELDYIPEDEHPGVVLKIHNSYLQMLVDSGVFAFLLYMFLLVGMIIALQLSARRCRKYYPDMILYPHALQIPLIAYAQFSLTGGRERYEFYYLLLMTAVAWLLIEKKLPRVSSPPTQATRLEAAFPGPIPRPSQPDPARVPAFSRFQGRASGPKPLPAPHSPASGRRG